METSQGGFLRAKILVEDGRSKRRRENTFFARNTWKSACTFPLLSTPPCFGTNTWFRVWQGFPLWTECSWPLSSSPRSFPLLGKTWHSSCSTSSKTETSIFQNSYQWRQMGNKHGRRVEWHGKNFEQTRWKHGKKRTSSRQRSILFGVSLIDSILQRSLFSKWNHQTQSSLLQTGFQTKRGEFLINNFWQRNIKQLKYEPSNSLLRQGGSSTGTLSVQSFLNRSLLSRLWEVPKISESFGTDWEFFWHR